MDSLSHGRGYENNLGNIQANIKGENVFGQTNRQTDRQTAGQTDSANYYIDIKY